MCWIFPVPRFWLMALTISSSMFLESSTARMNRTFGLPSAMFTTTLQKDDKQEPRSLPHRTHAHLLVERAWVTRLVFLLLGYQLINFTDKIIQAPPKPLNDYHFVFQTAWGVICKRGLLHACRCSIHWVMLAVGGWVPC